MIISVRETESGICVIDRNLSFKRFVELHFGPGEAEALRLRRDLETASVPLHDIVVADAALVTKAADAIEIFGSGTPGFFRIARCTTEAAVVVGKKTAQDLIGRCNVGCASQTEFAGKAILEGAPEAFDAALGLGTLGGDVSNAGQCQATRQTCSLGIAPRSSLRWG